MNWKIFKKKNNELDLIPQTTTKPTTDPKSNQPQGKVVKVSLNYLHKLIPIGELEDSVLQELRPRLIEYEPGNRIFDQGKESDSLFYLVKGKVLLETDSGSEREIDINTMAAFYPLSNGKIHQFTAIAASHAKILFFPRQLLQENKQNKLDHDELKIPESLINNSLYIGFHDTYKKGNLQIPTLPDVAIKLSNAVKQDIGIADAVKIVNLDPVIASKLIQTVNSPLYRTLTPAASCHDAVNRLGLTTTRTIVTSLCMRNLFKGNNKSIKKIYYQIWQQSIQMASICRALALTTREIDADEAMLAGLVHNIGAIPLLKFADSRPQENYQLDEIQVCLAMSTGVIGKFVLEKWKFPPSLLNIPMHFEDWFYDTGDKLTTCDIAILARFHSLIGMKKTSELPLLATLPAFQKLGKNSLNPDLSLQVLDDAKQQIAEAMNLFSA